MDKQEWLEWRKIGSSDAPAIMGVSPWDTLYSKWLEKMTKAHKPDNFYMKKGRDLEPIALKRFCELTKIIMFPQMMLEHPKIDFMTATLDGMDMDGKYAVEIKCPGEKDQEIARKKQIPEKYFPQLQHQMEVAGLEMIYYYSFDGTAGVLIEVEKNQSYIDEMVEREAAFWEMLKTQTPPPKTARDESREYTRRVDMDFLMAFNQLKDLDAARKKAEDEYQDHLKLVIEKAENQAVKCDLGKLSKTIVKGSVQYDLIPELQGVDKDRYRKDPYVKWQPRFAKIA